MLVFKNHHSWVSFPFTPLHSPQRLLVFATSTAERKQLGLMIPVKHSSQSASPSSSHLAFSHLTKSREPKVWHPKAVCQRARKRRPNPRLPDVSVHT